MNNRASLQLGGDNWAAKDGNLLAYKTSLLEKNFLPIEFDFSRGADIAATRINSSGLIEKYRENMIVYSNKFDESNWNKYNGASVSSTRVEGPFGEINAWELTFGTNNDSRMQQQITTVNGNIYNFSVWARVTSGTKNVRLGGVGSLVTKTLTTTWQRIENYGVETDTNASPQLRKDPAEGEYTIQIYGFQFERGLVATDYIESSATTGIAGVLDDLPRIDYSGSTPSLLLEPSRTNKILQSEYIGAWSDNDVSIDFGYLSPDGSNNAYKITANGSQPYIHAPAAGTIEPTDARTIYAKTTSGTGTAHLLTHNSNTNNLFTVTNEWQRFDISSVTSTTGQNNFYGVDLRGNSSLTEILIWGAQAETGNYPTSYIPTYGTSDTRGLETIVATGIGSSIGQEEGSLYAEYEGFEDTTNVHLAITDGTFNNTVAIGSTGDRFRFFYKGNTVTRTDNASAGSYVPNTRFKYAVRYKSTDSKVIISGSNNTNFEITNTNAFASPVFSSTVDTAENERGNDNSYFFGRIYNFMIFKDPLSDEELKNITII